MRLGSSAYSVCRQDVIYGDVRPAHTTTPLLPPTPDCPLKLRWLLHYTPAHSLKLLVGALQCHLHQTLCLCRDHPGQMNAENSARWLTHLKRHRGNSLRFTLTMPACSHLLAGLHTSNCQRRSWAASHTNALLLKDS